MSGRRLRDAVRQAMLDAGFPSDSIMVIAGLSNTYSDYVTTYEEYQVSFCSGAACVLHTIYSVAIDLAITYV